MAIKRNGQWELVGVLNVCFSIAFWMTSFKYDAFKLYFPGGGLRLHHKQNQWRRQMEQVISFHKEVIISKRFHPHYFGKYLIFTLLANISSLSPVWLLSTIGSQGSCSLGAEKVSGLGDVVYSADVLLMPFYPADVLLMPFYPAVDVLPAFQAQKSSQC